MEYKLKIIKGVDDLKSLYAFVGNSQGDETQTNSIEDYNTSQGWLSYQFPGPITEENILKEIESRKSWNEQYIKELKELEEYGSEAEMKLNIEYNPLLDTQTNLNFKKESYSFIIQDYGQFT